MNEHDSNSFNILIIGPGKDYFNGIIGSEIDTFEKNNLHLEIHEGFSGPEITQVMLSIGKNVISKLTNNYIITLFEKIFHAKERALNNKQIFQIHLSISEKLYVKNIINVREVETCINIVTRSPSFSFE